MNMVYNLLYTSITILYEYIIGYIIMVIFFYAELRK